jgi:translation initiation factor IF-2
MSKVRINDLAREMEVKSRQILDVLTELGLASGKTHSSSLEDFEAEKVRAQLRGSKSGGHSAAAPSRAAQGFQPKIDLSHISKPGDALKAILAKKQEEEAETRQAHAPVRTQTPAAKSTVPAVPASPAAAVVAPPAPTRPEPRRIVPQPRSAPPIVVAPPAPPAIASRPPTGAVVARPPAGAVVAKPPVVVVAPPPAGTRPAAAQAAPSTLREEQPRTAERPSAAKPAVPKSSSAAPILRDAPAIAAQAPALEATLSAAAVEPTAQAAAPVSELREPVKESQVSASIDVLEPELEVAAPNRTQINDALAATPPVRRMVMPQTGPRPVYKAPIFTPAATQPGTGNQAPGAGIVRGRPIFDRRPTGGPGTSSGTGPGSYPQRSP